MAADRTSGAAAPSNAAPDLQRTKPTSPRRLITDGIRNQSTAEIVHALQLDRSLLPFALSSAVSKGSVPLTAYLLTTERAPVDTLTPLNIATALRRAS